MAEILCSSTFSVIGVPLLFVLIGILANHLGRRDNEENPSRNEWAIGTIVSLMALGNAIAEMWNSPSFVSDYLAWIVIFLVMLFLSINNDRYKSWKRDSEGNPTNEKALLMGIIIPNTITTGVFIVSRAMIVGIL